jgi:type IV pilus assembly protein PilY1
VAVLLLLITNFSFGEDIELYISDSVSEAKKRPQVLIIFDNSGSMGTLELVKPSYNPLINYPAVNGYPQLTGDYIYYSKGQTDIDDMPIADDPNEDRKFPASISSCKVAQDIINQYGYYTGFVREYTFQGNSGRWSELNETDGTDIIITDCEDDVDAINNNNKNYLQGSVPIALPSGFPIDGEGDPTTPVFYTANVGNSNVEWSGSLVTLYSENYLRWYHSDTLVKVIKSRIGIAQESVTNLINSSPNVDFGLQVFNHNATRENSRDGGRIVFGIKASTVSSRTALLDIINNQLDPENNTPLCETLYEASRYFGGKSVYYGDNDSNRSSYTANTPPRDTTIETSDKIYKSPFTSCSDKAYVILITDGAPTLDTAANDEVRALGTADGYPMADYEGNYLAALAGWMNNNDVNAAVDGKQTVTTYTIGFSQGAEAAEPLLREAADLGGGKYFPAQDTASLTAALTNVLANLEPSNDSLTSASVAANNFDRTETLDSVYYAMFQPDRGPRWQGNLKKYKVEGGVQVGKSGTAAIDESTGHFSSSVTSYWSDSRDGADVAEGGVADMLRNKTDRLIYSDIGTSNALVELTPTNKLSHFGTEEDYANFLGVDVLESDDYFNWNLGIDVDDEDKDGDKTDMRSDVFGDPLHSNPLVINYGNKIHLLIGTNAGALHMFEDTGDDVDETWAFMPKEFFPNIKTLRNNATSDDKVYGVDGKITSYIDDQDGDGIIESGDKVWIFFGLRRGGSSYYAIDISNPNSPRLMWRIEGGTTGFTELGQTWSQAKLGYSKLNLSGDTAKPVLFFGGGYDPSKDNTGVGAEDNVGRAVYMVDAETGTLIWSMAEDNATTEFTGEDSIPSSIATLDSDGNGLVDRLYVGDTGGGVWRVDMPSDSLSDISVFKLASLGGDTNLTDRRFFNEPAIVRTFITETIESEIKAEDESTSTVIVQQEIPYDAILLGSGDKSNPLGTDTSDTFFMIKDKNIITQSFGDGGTSIPDVIAIGDLYDFTDNPFETVSDTGRQALSVAVSNKSGWYFDLELSGEKSTATAIVINNTVYFTTFSPPNLAVEQIDCELPNGQGWLYGVDLALGISKFNWSEADSKNREDRISFISEQFLGAPTLIVIPNDPDDATAGTTGNLIVGRKIVDIGFNLQTMRTYLYITEDQ